MNMDQSSANAMAAELEALRARVVQLEARSSTEAAYRYLDTMERIGRVLRSDPDIDVVLTALLDEVLAIFGCDRAWLLYPCDPTAVSWGVPRERTRKQWPGAFSLGVQVPMDPGTSALFSDALAADAPLVFDAESDRTIPADLARAFHIQSQVAMTLRPRTGQAWLMGLHHCERAHVFTPEEIDIFEGICRRVSESLEALILLRDLTRSEQRFRTLVDHAPDAIVVMEQDGRIVDANDAALDLFGLTRGRLLTTPLQTLAPDEQPGGRPSDGLFQSFLDEALAGWKPRFDWLVRADDGSERATEVRLVALEEGAGKRVRGSIVDMSERRSLEMQVRHLQKMEALGELAGGVAHDLNNQLVVILCYAEMLGELDGAESTAATLADRVVRAASDAASLTSQLLAFSRRTVLTPSVVDLGELVATAGPMLERLLGPSFQLQLELPSTPNPAFVDLQQIQQVLVNLVTNARDASPDGGEIRITTALREVGPDVAGQMGLPPGRYATMAVQDQGTGIDAATRGRLFEPFFTTKERGKGTGLGLSTARGVVENSGGAIEVDTAPGKGSCFTVFLPVAGTDVAEEAAPTPRVPAPGGHERILLVEEHQAVAEIAAQVLSASGYDVVRADARSAPDVLQQQGPFDLLLTEVMLRGGDGATLAARLRDLHPGLKVLFTTSFSAQAIENFTHSPERVVLLQKPYSPDGLLARVRRVLDGEAPEAPSVVTPS